MNILPNIVFFVLIWIFSISYIASSPANSLQTKLHLIQRIFIDYTPTPNEFPARLKELLRAEGFTIVDRREEAEAIMSFATEVWVCVDCDKREANRPDKQVVELKTISGKLIWKTKFAVDKDSEMKEGMEFRAQEITKRLRADRERDMKKYK